MTTPEATVVIPTFNHGATLLLAVKTALAQTMPVEIFIIGDGVSNTSRAMILDLVSQHNNIRFFDHPKHESRGEPHRHTALLEAQGRIVCYLCDRDLWMPDHVERMSFLLKNADFAHSLSLHILNDTELQFFSIDVALPEWRDHILTRTNKIAFSCWAHTLAFYKTLERGWETTPKNKATDWHMLQQFMERPDCKCVSGTYPSAITFPSPPHRIHWTEEQRIAELQNWITKIDTPEHCQSLAIDILEANVSYFSSTLSIQELYQREMLLNMLHSPWWRLGNKISGIGARVLKRLGY